MIVYVFKQHLQLVRPIVKRNRFSQITTTCYNPIQKNNAKH